MKNKTILYFLIILNSLILFSCSEESDVAAINKRVNELEIVVEKHQENKLKSYLAKDFVTAKNLNTAQFLLFSRYQLNRNKNISIVIIEKDVVSNNQKFDIEFRVLLLSSNNFLPGRGQMYKIASRWKKEDGDWVISRLRWEKFNANE